MLIKSKNIITFDNQLLKNKNTQTQKKFIVHHLSLQNLATNARMAPRLNTHEKNSSFIVHRSSFIVTKPYFCAAIR